jgi:hypothetical protein
MQKGTHQIYATEGHAPHVYKQTHTTAPGVIRIAPNGQVTMHKTAMVVKQPDH